MAGQRPRQGWIYMINPYRVSLRCKSGHIHMYDLVEPGDIQCKSCTLMINSSRVFRGEHPYIIWTGDQFQDESGYIQTFIAIPLTSQRTSLGLPTTYPIVNTTRNGLTNTSYALVHQICTIDGNCFKDKSGNWISRMGQLDGQDKQKINKRLIYSLGIDQDPDDDWFKQNASPELVKKVYDFLPSGEKESLLSKLLEDLE